MIVWLGGTFGAGKTTTARLLLSGPGAVDLRFFDPEWLGFLLREHLADVEVSDFQQYPSWRRLVPVVAAELAHASGQDLLVAQTVLVEAYWDELVAGCRALGHDVRLVLLEADETVMRRRIETDDVEARAADWRLHHLTAYRAARPWLVAGADLVIDTTDLTPEGTADRMRTYLQP